MAPKAVGKRLYFYSNLSGKLSLYAMDHGGSIPEPLLPPEIALQNPHLQNGKPYEVFPDLDKVLVMIDHDGDEKYQPMFIPTEGGYPTPVFGSQLADYRTHLLETDTDKGTVYLVAESLKE